MNVLTVAVILATTFAYVTEAIAEGPCQKQVQSIKKCYNGLNPPGMFVPTCDASGFFAKQQCSGSTGYCKCVYTDTGIPYTYSWPPGTNGLTCDKDTQSANDKTIGPCADFLHNWQIPEFSTLLGAKKPQCDFSGNFKKRQYDASTGIFQCVYTDTGKVYFTSATPADGGVPPTCEKNKQPICN